MSHEVQFDLDTTTRFQPKQTRLRLVSWIMAASGGFIKSEDQANYVLLGVSLLLIIVSVSLLFSEKKTPYDEKVIPAMYVAGDPNFR